MLHSYVYCILCFRFKEGTFRLNVWPMSKLNIICPHMATSLVATNDSSSNSPYENFWIVDNSSYHSCNVDTSITKNKILFKCDKPMVIYFDKLVFQSHSTDNSRKFIPGKTYYFICKYILCMVYNENIYSVYSIILLWFKLITNVSNQFLIFFLIFLIFITII